MTLPLGKERQTQKGAGRETDGSKYEKQSNSKHLLQIIIKPSFYGNL